MNAQECNQYAVRADGALVQFPIGGQKAIIVSRQDIVRIFWRMQWRRVWYPLSRAW
jgi:hypothetical protein